MSRKDRLRTGAQFRSSLCTLCAAHSQAAHARAQDRFPAQCCVFALRGTVYAHIALRFACGCVIVLAHALAQVAHYPRKFLAKSLPAQKPPILAHLAKAS